jgi:primosomal protein N''
MEPRFWAGDIMEMEPSSVTKDPGLVGYMTTMQYRTAKLDLSIQTKNKKLADFYLDELGENLEEMIEEVPNYDGHEIKKWSDQLLEPELDTLRKQLTTEQWAKIDRQMKSVINACNACHAKTDHAFIRITRASASHPFNQDFSPR